MTKEIKTVDEARGVVRVTTISERWYARPTLDARTGLPQYEFVPSVTWITSHYPLGIGFYKWLAAKGWDEAEAIKEAAGARGSKVHTAIAKLLEGETIRMEMALPHPSTGQPDPLTLEEYDAILAFAAWHGDTTPVLVDHEFVVWNAQEGYAGTVDLLCTIAGQPWL